MECEPQPEVNETSGGLRRSVTGVFWQGYERIKENPYVQSGLEKSISTVSYITPGIAQDSIKQYYTDASAKISNIYTNPKESLNTSKEYIGGKLSDGKGYIGDKLTSGTEILSSARDKVGTKVGAGTGYVKDKLASNSEYVQSSRIGQVVKSGVDKGLSAADGVIDYLLPGEEEQGPGGEEGVWGHGKKVTGKAKDRLTSLVANKYYQTGDYISSKYSKGRDNMGVAKDYAYELTAAKGHQISRRFQVGKDYMQTMSMIQRLSNNFGEAVLSAEENLEKYLPKRAASPEGSDEIEKGSIGHVMELTRRIQRRLMGRLKVASAMLPSVKMAPGPGMIPENMWVKLPQVVDQLPIPKTLKGYLPHYFKKENEQGKVEDKTLNSL